MSFKGFIKRSSTAGILALLLSALPALASPADPYVEINLNSPKDSPPLTLAVTSVDGEGYGWLPAQTVELKASVTRRDGTLVYVQDIEGNDSWRAVLGGDKSVALSIVPARDSYGGKINVTADGKPVSSDDPQVLEKVYEYRFEDGARVKIHFTDQMLEENGSDAHLPRQAMDAAVNAYQTITQFKGFSSPGFSFAQPDMNYAFDSDRTIDVYLGDPKGADLPRRRGFNNLSFKDAPCFDTVRTSEKTYEAVILLPANYSEFIRNWERINPSPLGRRNVEVDLRGTLIHEMLHVILFYYNKNLNKDGLPREGASEKADWYVEGLARYFETFAGARHDFFSQGFKQMLPDKIRFSRGGTNYFMRYPDQAFTDLRYENALFWRFIDYRFGMERIILLSKSFRGEKDPDFKNSLELATGIPFKELLKTFAMSILFKDFALKEDADFLMNIARTHLIYKHSGFYVRDGFGEERALGSVCRTDWIGQWQDVKARFGDLPAAGDNTEKSDVSGWATDFIEIEVQSGRAKLPWLGVSHVSGGEPLVAQLVVVSKGGSSFKKTVRDIPPGRTDGVDLQDFLNAEGLKSEDIATVYVLVTNTDPKKTSDYTLVLR
jgi:hypothetical protein